MTGLDTGSHVLSSAQPGSEILQERLIHKRYLALYDRKIKLPAAKDRRTGKIFDYDVVGHPQCNFHFSVVFPYHKPRLGSPGEVTILREHCQGPNQMMFVLPTGGFSPSKHHSWLHCAQSELSEEAYLKGGEWHSLLPDHHPGMAEVKWCRNRFSPFLCVDPEEDFAPGKRDAEELIEVHRVSVETLRNILASGEMVLPSVSTSFMALELLQKLQLLS